MSFFGNLGFPSVILVKKSLKALCLSSKMVYQHLLYLLWLWTYWRLKSTQGPTHFLNVNFRGCWRSRPEHNGPKQQWKGRVKKTDRNGMDDLVFFYVFNWYILIYTGSFLKPTSKMVLSLINPFLLSCSNESEKKLVLFMHHLFLYF